MNVSYIDEHIGHGKPSFLIEISNIDEALHFADQCMEEASIAIVDGAYQCAIDLLLAVKEIREGVVAWEEYINKKEDEDEHDV